MAAISLGVWWLAVVLLWSPMSQCKPSCTGPNITSLVTDAVIRINHKIEQSINKLEEHEFREKTYWKGVTNTLEKTTNELKPLNNKTSVLDERLSKVEAILLHAEEREEKAQKKTTEAIEGLMKSFQTLTSTLKGLKKDSSEDNATRDDSVEKRLNLTDSKIEDVKNLIENLTANFNEESLRSMCLKVIDTSQFTKHIADAEKLLNRYDMKLDEHSEKSANASKVAPMDEVDHKGTIEEMKRQGEEITKIQKLLLGMEGAWKKLPGLSGFSEFQVDVNQTLDAVIRAIESLKENNAASMDNVTTEIRELSDRVMATNESIQQTVEQGNANIGGISDGLMALGAQLQIVAKSEPLIREIANNKKEIQRTGNQIVNKFGQTVSKIVYLVKEALSLQQDHIESSIIGNQTASASRLDKYLNDEFAQLWRLVTDMKGQLLASNKQLEKLTGNTDKYISSSTRTMTEVKDDVSSTAKRTVRISENLSEALTKLQHATEELSLMTTGLSAAMTGLSTDVHAMQAKMDKDAGR